MHCESYFGWKKPTPEQIQERNKRKGGGGGVRATQEKCEKGAFG